MMDEEELKVGDIVRVNERSIGGKILKHEWEGKIIWISKDRTVANVRELGSDGGLFWRDTRNLEKSDREASCQ